MQVYYDILHLMENNPDIIYDKSLQTKLLILFVMNRISRPVTMDVLTELVSCDERINYFDITDCIHKLVKSKHLYLTDNKYSLSAKGSQSGKIIENDLPYSVRVKAERAVSHINEALSKDSLIVTRHSACEEGGYNVILSLADGISEILSITLRTANQKQAKELEKGFNKNAQSLYRDIISLITRRE